MKKIWLTVQLLGAFLSFGFIIVYGLFSATRIKWKIRAVIPKSLKPTFDIFFSNFPISKLVLLTCLTVGITLLYLATKKTSFLPPKVSPPKPRQTAIKCKVNQKGECDFLLVGECDLCQKYLERKYSQMLGVGIVLVVLTLVLSVWIWLITTL